MLIYKTIFTMAFNVLFEIGFLSNQAMYNTEKLTIIYSFYEN